MAEFNVLSKRCPVCGNNAVGRMSDHLRFKGPTHQCNKCGSELKAATTWRVLWGVPAGVLLLGAAYLFVTWLQQSNAITGVLRAALIGAAWGGAVACTGNIMLRGIVFRSYVNE